MAEHNIDNILERWQRRAGDAGYNRERDKGTAFEDLCRAFLTHDSVQEGQYLTPLRYADWARERGLPEQDIGIDLVAKLRNTEGWCAIQCKFWVKGKTLRKQDVDSFLASSGRKDFARRLIIDTTGKPWSKQLEDTIRFQRVPVTRLGLHELRESPIDWAKYIRVDQIVRKGPKKTPLPHQEEAIQRTLSGLRTPGSRGKLLMACGTGKTFTSLRIAEDLVGTGGRVLYLVPSLALMSQTVREWSADARHPLRSYAVCSDSQVGRRRRRNDDRIDMDVLDLALPATTDAVKLAQDAGLEVRDKLTVVFATYHSLPVIGEAQRKYGLPDFDLAICDEAHRTAGSRKEDKAESHFVQIHNQEHLQAHRRLYMTATPKVYAPAAHKKADKRSVELFSMKDKETYGPVLYEIGFGTAVEAGLLSDYKVIVLTVSEDDVVRTVGDTMSRHELKLDDAGKLIGCWRALAKVDEEEFQEDHLSMRRAIAYCKDIKTSKKLAELFHEVTQQYRQSHVGKSEAGMLIDHEIASEHVDGTFDALSRAERLDWLDAVQASDRRCHVLSNVRCLSEGVDVPALDAILFMHPRKSQIEVVQAVGRVMRRSKGKKMGYVVLPVVIPSTSDPSEYLDNYDTFRVVWQVLNAIRSHDERFEAMLNLLEEGQIGKHLGIIALSDWQERSKPSLMNGHETPGNGNTDEVEGKEGQQLNIEFDLPAAIRAKIVEKCGNRRYWEEWADDVAEIAQKHIVRIGDMVSRHEAAREVFQDFLAELQDDLNEGVSEQDAIEMLAQHMVTRPVFEALHGNGQFVDQNPISKGMQLVLEVLKPANIEVEAESLDEFYASVARRAKAASTPLDRQRIITELYDKFFRNAFPKTAQRLGIVYTPIELVDFVLHSVSELLRDEFGQSLSSAGVEILDPFTGTGTFITRILQNGLISPESLMRKYASEIHANEIMLLAYYIAAVNIEEAYHAMVGSDDYHRFEGIILTDTFEMQDSPDMIAGILPENSEQRKRQKKAEIRVIVGNPPWSTGQRSQNDAAQNQSYPVLNKRIEDSYAAHSNASSKRNLYDSYVLAIRWASDRIGESGVIGFVTNASWLEGAAMDGMRKCLADEFTSIYVLSLRGNQRTQGELSRQEGGKVFGAGSRAPVAITLFIKNPKRRGCRIFYHDIGDYLSREEKLEKVEQLGGIHGIEGKWTELKPDAYHDWLNQRDAGFEEFMPLGDKKGRSKDVIFKNYSLGVATGRDAWCYNYSEIALRWNIRAMIRFYESERQRLQDQNSTGSRPTPAEVTRFVNNDSTKISWTVNLKEDLAKNKELSIQEGRFVVAQYRPFTRKHMFFSRRLNERVYQIPQLFPHEEAENRLICVTGVGATDDFSCLMVKEIPNLDFISKGQCFPRWCYTKRCKNQETLFPEESGPDSYGYVREDAIKEEVVQAFEKCIGGVSTENLFNYIYGLLHAPSYRKKYAANFRKELPRIPIPESLEEFQMLSQAGKELGELHINYEEVKEYPINFEDGGWEPAIGIFPEAWFKLQNRPMRHPGKARNKDRTRIIYNEHIAVKGIPEEAYNYMMNGKPAIAWVMERQRAKTDGASQIINDANCFAIETMQDPSYPLRLLAKVITVSMETLRIVEKLRDNDYSWETWEATS
ncbi:MAG: DEAD/DEAH box helicase [Rhodothermaceae bacterium]|nr:DEAD/DEAH box helicase [Rhodothermaceae bacterium]MXX59646.1 DEAD/DEAH box helicase [Rhodothermaceae bacterium]MYD19459.1 DEAD/DEAH box helicase [Rhodothermaceae bacterium]